MAETLESPGKHHRRAKGMEEAKATPEITTLPPRLKNQPPPAAPLSSRFVPVVAHAGGLPLISLEFVFYRPEWPNSLAPFCTAQKPVCGARFQPDAHQGRSRIDVPSTDTLRWRSFHCPKPQLAAAQPRQ